MPRSCSADIRERVIAVVEGGASRREAAEQFGVSASAAVKWLQCWHVTGRSTAKPRGGKRSPLEGHKEWLLDLMKRQPDLTLDEILAAMGKQGIAGSRTAVWRFLERHKISFKKKFARGRAGTSGRRPGPPALAPRTRRA